MLSHVDNSSEAKSDQPPLSTQTLFDLICEGAKEGDKNKIDSALRYGSIHITTLASPSPAHALALEQTPESKSALNFLIENYPSERNTFLSSMMYAYASRGNVDEVNQILDQAKTSAERFSLLVQMAAGFALNGQDIEKSIQILDQANNVIERMALLKMMACQYAKGGHFTQANSLLNLTKSIVERNEIIKNIAYGYAKSGYVNQANELLKDTSLDEETSTEVLVLISYAYSRTNDQHTEEEKILNSTTNPQLKLRLLRNQIFGYGYSDQVDKAYHVLKKNPDHKDLLLEDLAGGFAAAGNINAIMILLERKDIAPADRIKILNYIALQYAKNGHITAAYDLLENARYISTRVWAEIAQNMLRGYALKGRTTEAQEMYDLLSTIDSNNWEDNLQILACGYIEGGYLDEAKNLLRFVADDPRKLLEVFASTLKQEPIEFDNDAILFLLAKFNPDYHKELIKHLMPPGTTENTQNKLASQATELHFLLRKPSSLTSPINYRRIVGTNYWSLTLKWLLMAGPKLVTKNAINTNLLYIIATFLAPISITNARKLSTQLSTHRFRLFATNQALEAKTPNSERRELDDKSKKMQR